MFLRAESSAFKSQSCTKIVYANKIITVVVVIIIISIIAVMDDAVKFLRIDKAPLTSVRRTLVRFYASNCRWKVFFSLILLPDVGSLCFTILSYQNDWQSNKRVMLLHLIMPRHLHWTLKGIWQPWHAGDLLCQINTSPRIYIVVLTIPPHSVYFNVFQARTSRRLA